MVNIKDMGEEQDLPVDLLGAIFAKQRALEAKYNIIEVRNGEDVPNIPLDIDSFRGQRRARALIYRITEELYEAGNCLRNKAWKSSMVATDQDHFKEELVDGLHFYIQLFIELGLNEEDVYRLYCKKNQVNQFRQNSNY